MLTEACCKLGSISPFASVNTSGGSSPIGT